MAGWGAVAQAATQAATAFGTAAMAGAQNQAGIAANDAQLRMQHEWSAEAQRFAVDSQRYNMQHAHQWEVDDLRKAGLNPILSGLGGGGATAGSTAGYSAPSSHDAAAGYRSQADVISRAGSGLGQALSDLILGLNKRSLEDSQAKKEDAAAINLATDAKLKESQTSLATEQYKTEQTRQSLNSAQAAAQLQDVDTGKANAMAAMALSHERNALSGLHSAKTQTEKTENNLKELDYYIKHFGADFEKYLLPAERLSRIINQTGISNLVSIGGSGLKKVAEKFFERQGKTAPVPGNSGYGSSPQQANSLPPAWRNRGD